MANLTYRASSTPTVPASTTVKLTPLTNLEVDANFKALNDAILASIGANAVITSLTGLTTPLSVAQGGTGTTSVTGLVKGNGTGAFTAAVVRTDYAEATKTLATGILKNTTTTGAHTIAVAGTDYQAPLVSASNIKTINSTTVLGSGDLVVSNTITNDTTTNATRYILFDDVTSGNSSTFGVASTKLTFNPSTGSLAPTELNATTAIKIGGTTIFDSNRRLTNYRLNTVEIGVNTTAVSGNHYVATAAVNLTLPITPVVGEVVGFQNSSGLLTCAILRNGSNIMSIAEDMTVNVLNHVFTLQYAGATRGWVFA